MIRHPFAPRPLPEALDGLNELAMDLRWSGSRLADRLWERLDADLWARTRNPYLLLHTVAQSRLDEAANDPEFTAALRGRLDARRKAQDANGWFRETYPDAPLETVAYFSLEYGLGEHLPLYAGGLGILAGDHLKTASDVGLPLVGVGLLYDQGYFQQLLTADGWQVEGYPYNDPTALPITPVAAPDGSWLHVEIDLPGRTLALRVWEVCVGAVTLYLLDSNDLLNGPWDRAITSALYGGSKEQRLLQEWTLAFGGWKALETLGLRPDVCHLNEGHAAFVTLARARAAMGADASDLSFWEALRATRAGNLFTTHTPVAAGFDRFDRDLVGRFLALFGESVGVPADHLLDLGREPGRESQFSMAALAARTSGHINGVSRLHGAVSRELFAPLFPGHPLPEIPVGYVTNAIHPSTWASSHARDLWTKITPEADLPEDFELTEDALSSPDLWAFRNEARRNLLEYVQKRLQRQALAQGVSAAEAENAGHGLNPDVLTIGFARRFAAYKRPTLLMHDLERLKRLLLRSDRPVQIILAGKAHPGDEGGKRMVQEIVRLAADPAFGGRIVFLADYDMTLTQQMVAGVDLWLNTPRRPMEASGTSGMKVLVNGGLNFSELDGWWAEAYTPEVGWALGDGAEHGEEWDAVEADQLYATLENEILPAFYERDADGLPRAWLTKVRASMAHLTPRFSGRRMLREYTQVFYLPAAEAVRKRLADGGRIAKDLEAWSGQVRAHWGDIRVVCQTITEEEGRYEVNMTINFGALSLDHVRVEIYADGKDGQPPVREPMRPYSPDKEGDWVTGSVPADRPISDYTLRILPFHPDALPPFDAAEIAWLAK